MLRGLVNNVPPKERTFSRHFRIQVEIAIDLWQAGMGGNRARGDPLSHFRCFLKKILMLQRKPEQFSSRRVQDVECR